MRPEQLGFKLVQKNLWRRPTDDGYVQLNRKWDDGEEVYTWSIAEFDSGHKRIDRIFDDWSYEDESEQVPQKIIQHNEALLSEEVDMSGDKYLRMLTEDKSSWNVDAADRPLAVGDRVEITGPVYLRGDKGEIAELLNGFCVVNMNKHGDVQASFQCSDVTKIEQAEDIDESTLTEGTYYSDEEETETKNLAARIIVWGKSRGLEDGEDMFQSFSDIKVGGAHWETKLNREFKRILKKIGDEKGLMELYSEETGQNVYEQMSDNVRDHIHALLMGQVTESKDTTLTEATVEQSDAFWEISEELNDEVMPDEIEAIWKGSLKGLPLEDIMSDLPAVTNKDVLAVQDKLREKELRSEAKKITQSKHGTASIEVTASFANDEDSGGDWGDPEYFDVDEFFVELKKRGIKSNVSKSKINREEEEINFDMILTGTKTALESFMNEYFIPEDERDETDPFVIKEALDLTTVDFSKDVAVLKKHFAATPERRDGFKLDPNSGVAVVKTEEQHANFPQEVKNAIRNLVTKGVDVRFSMFESKKKLREAKEDIEFAKDEKVFTVKIEKTSVGSFFFTADTRNAGEAVGRVLRDESVEFVPYKKNGKFELHLNVQDFNRDQDVRKLITKLKKRATEWLIAIESGENIKKVADEAESIGNPGDIKKSLDSAVKSTKVKIDFVWPEGTVKPKPDMEEDEAPAADEKEKIDDLKDELKESKEKKKSKTLKEADNGESFVVIEPIVDLMVGIEEKAKKHGVTVDEMGGDQSSKWKVFGKVAALESFLMDIRSVSREEARKMIMDSGALHEDAGDERAAFEKENKELTARVRDWLDSMQKHYETYEYDDADFESEFGEDADQALNIAIEENWLDVVTRPGQANEYVAVDSELIEDATDIGAPTAEDVKKAKQATGI